MNFLKQTLILTLLTFCHCLPNNSERFNKEDSENPSKSYRPVVIIHGVMAEYYSMQATKDFILKEHPGTDVYYPELYLDYDSLDSLWDQIRSFLFAIDYHFCGQTVNLVAYSQGGMIARGLIEVMGLDVHNFISLSSPLAGQYGDAGLDYIGVNRSEAYKVLYHQYANKAPAQYWNDPHHQEEYLKFCEFLPEVNNEKPDDYREPYAHNFKKLNKLVLIGGPDDGIITPWQSSHFSFYDANETVVDFRKRDIYTKDLFGLKTLDQKNKIQIYEEPDVMHHYWYRNEKVLRQYVLPWLD